MNTSDRQRWIYIVVLLLVLVGVKYYQRVTSTPDINTTTAVEALRGKQIIYTKHARCRMDCRTISKEEVIEALATGRVNEKKSDPNDRPCPTYAIEDLTEDGQLVRIVFAGCDDVVKVVTAIDLNNEYQCTCE